MSIAKYPLLWAAIAVQKRGLRLKHSHEDNLKLGYYFENTTTKKCSFYRNVFAALLTACNMTSKPTFLLTSIKLFLFVSRETLQRFLTYFGVFDGIVHFILLLAVLCTSGTCSCPVYWHRVLVIYLFVYRHILLKTY